MSKYVRGLRVMSLKSSSENFRRLNTNRTSKNPFDDKVDLPQQLQRCSMKNSPATKRRFGSILSEEISLNKVICNNYAL